MAKKNLLDTELEFCQMIPYLLVLLSICYKIIYYKGLDLKKRLDNEFNAYIQRSILTTWLLVYDLTHWGRVMHICISKLTIIELYDGLLPGQHQAIIWTIAETLLIGPMGTNFSEILI